MTRLGVAELNVLGDVHGGEPDVAGASGHGDAAVGMDGGHGPVVAVLDHQSLVGAQPPVISSGNHLVPDEDRGVAKVESRAGWVELSLREAGILGEVVEPSHGLGAVGHERHRLAPSTSLVPGGEDLGLHFVERAAVKPAMPLVLDESGWVAAAKT